MPIENLFRRLQSPPLRGDVDNDIGRKQGGRVQVRISSAMVEMHRRLSILFPGQRCIGPTGFFESVRIPRKQSDGSVTQLFIELLLLLSACAGCAANTGFGRAKYRLRTERSAEVTVVTHQSTYGVMS
jgi:hypothetical protein